MLHSRLITLTLVVLAFSLAATINAQEAGQKSAENNKSSSATSKVCLDKLDTLKASGDLSQEKVTDLFEQALINIANSNDYLETIRASAKPGAIEEYDRNGGLFVLMISDKRREFLAALNEPKNSLDDKEKSELLELYFELACGFEENTKVSLKAMQKSVFKINASINKY